MDELRKTRNLEFDVIKFIACCAVICLHYSTAFCGKSIFGGGSVACELFFMISGYLMMPSIHQGNTGIDALKFIGSRLKRIYPPFLLSSIIYYLMYYGVNIEQKVFSFSEEFEKIIWGGVFLSETGMGTAIGNTWYISAMLIGMLVLYPILSVTSENKFFSCAYAPVFTCFIYAFLKTRYGMTQADTYVITGDAIIMVLPNLMRAIAGLMLGNFIYSISQYCPINITKRKRVCLKVIELSLMVVVFGVIMQKTAFSKWDFVEVLCFFFVLLIMARYPYEIEIKKLDQIVRYLGRLSLPMYLFQSVAGYCIEILDAYGLKNYVVRTMFFWTLLVGLAAMYLYFTDHKRKLSPIRSNK